MATYITLLLFLMASLIFSPSFATNTISRNPDILTAIQEMQKANYFTFVLLINMAPSHLTQGNLTFLMPNDRTLAKTLIPENTLTDFLLRHSIHSPLLFDHLQHIPTGSVIPTSDPNFMLRVYNNGRRQFFLNNVRVISPNICTLGASIKCHGIDGVLVSDPTTVSDHNGSTNSSPSCSSSGTPPPVVSPAPMPMPSLEPPTGDGIDLTPTPLAVPSPSPSSPNASLQKSSCSSHRHSRGGLFELLITFMLLTTKFST